METVDGLFERTDGIEVPRSWAENSLFAVCIWIVYSAVIKEKQIIDNDVKGGCSKNLVLVHRPSHWKLSEVLRNEQTQNEQVVGLLLAMRRYGQAVVSRMSPVDSIVLESKIYRICICEVILLIG